GCLLTGEGEAPAEPSSLRLGRSLALPVRSLLVRATHAVPGVRGAGGCGWFRWAHPAVRPSSRTSVPPCPSSPGPPDVPGTDGPRRVECGAVAPAVRGCNRAASP